jgi:hypothetical protein
MEVRPVAYPTTQFDYTSQRRRAPWLSPWDRPFFGLYSPFIALPCTMRVSGNTVSSA